MPGSMSEVSKKSSAISEIIRDLQGHELDARYLGYFRCFNRRLYYEAHDVLEELWLPQRAGPNGAFYKGLIQLAGAFVHLQKNRLRPAAALLKLAQANLERYPLLHERLDVGEVRNWIREWIRWLEDKRFETNPLTELTPPLLQPLS